MWTATPARTIAASMTAALATFAAGAASPPHSHQPHFLSHLRQPDTPPRLPRPNPCGEGLGVGGPTPHCRGSPRIRLANEGATSPFSFLESLFGVPPSPRRPPAYRSEPRRESPRQGRGRQDRTPPAPAAVRHEPGASGGGATYRTVCVRLCDGYYWPISFATHEARFARDSATCTKSCGAPAALYYYPNPGGEPEDMVSLQGVPYKSLGTAFLFRTRYDADCKCRPHPWEGEAIERVQANAQAKEARALPPSGRSDEDIK
jgi:Protein of unknown function (DUF2865)